LGDENRDEAPQPATRWVLAMDQLRVVRLNASSLRVNQIINNNDDIINAFLIDNDVGECLPLRYIRPEKSLVLHAYEP
jgi:hypothetical protein